MLRRGKNVRFTRRGFLQLAAGAVAFPAIVPGKALGLDGATAASERITLGFIGIGKMAKGHHGAFLGDPTTQVLAICDVERHRREAAAQKTDEVYADRYGKGNYKACDHYNDFRELCARPDIDACIIATPNHWHALCAVEALRNGKDVYLEKPLTRTIDEAKILMRTVRQYGRVLQVGSQQRSDPAFRLACELVRNGHLGKIKEVWVNVGPTSEECHLPGEPVPDGLDWDMWLGPAPWRPYSSVLAPPESYDGWPAWRYYRDYAGGGMDDFGAHHFDIAQWGLGTDDTGPVSVAPPDGKDIDKLTYTYASGIKMYRGESHPKAAVEWFGERGRLRVNRGEYLESEPAGIANETIAANDIRLYKSDNHKDNWLEAVRYRKEPICPVEVGAHTAIICHIGNIAYWLNRPLQWDPAKMEFVNDPEANRMLARPNRAPWQLV